MGVEEIECVRNLEWWIWKEDVWGWMLVFLFSIGNFNSIRLW